MAGILALTLLAAPAAYAETTGVLAEYHGRLIDLSVDWEGAEACHVGEGFAKCFDSERQMDHWLSRNAVDAGSVAARSSCSSYLRLYDGTSYTGASLNLTTRNVWLNLSSYGFNQRTSSYKIGPCSATFADYANGGGAQYPWYLTEAYDQASSMIPGWNNDVSSVKIN